MPVKAELHAATCGAVTGGQCNCTPTELLLTQVGDPQDAAAIHGGNAGRLKIIGIVPPPRDWTRPLPAQKRSQAHHHRAISD